MPATRINNRIYASDNEIYNQLNLYIGSYKAGNKSMIIKNNINTFAYYLFKQKLISKDLYSRIIKFNF